MKKIYAIILSVCMLLTFVGCKTKKPDETIPTDKIADTLPQTPAEEVTEPSITQATMTAVSVPTVTEEITAEDGTVLFQYTYQHMSLVLQEPDVANKVIVDFLNRVDTTRSAAESIKKAAEEDYAGQSEWIPYLYHVTYSPKRIDHSVLSLFGTNASYSGSFHPERTCMSASYDLITGDMLTLGSIMDACSTTDDFCNLVLSGLSEMAEDNYLYSGYEDAVKQRFAVDESQDQDWYFTQTGLCFYFEPYEIAPYSSGVITVEIPYEKLTNLLHPNYFPSERENAAGAVQICRFEDADSKQFTQIAEVIQDKNGQMYFIYTDKSVQDVRIFVTDAASSYAIFAAYGLTPGDAVMVQVDADSAATMKINYRSIDGATTLPLLNS